MAIEVSWMIEGRVIYARGTDSVDDMAARNHIYLQMIEEAGQPPMVHVIVDYTGAPSRNRLVGIHYYVDSPKLSLDEARSRLVAHPLLGWMVMVGAPNPSLKLAGRVLAAEGRYHRHHCDTLEEAFAFLEKEDATLVAGLPK